MSTSGRPGSEHTTLQFRFGCLVFSTWNLGVGVGGKLEEVRVRFIGQSFNGGGVFLREGLRRREWSGVDGEGYGESRWR